MEKPIFHPLPSYSNAAPPATQTGQSGTRTGFKGSWLGVIAVIVAILVLRSAFSRTSTPRVAPTRTPIPATRTALPATRTATVAQPTLWTDPKGRLNLRLPSGWSALPPDSTAKPEDIVTLVSPTGVRLSVQSYPPNGTIDDQFAAERRSQSAVTNRTFTQGPVTDVTVGGEPGKYMEFRAVWAATYTASSTSAVYAPYMGIGWIVDHGGNRFFFLVLDVKTSRAACDAIIASVAFPK